MVLTVIKSIQYFIYNLVHISSLNFTIKVLQKPEKSHLASNQTHCGLPLITLSYQEDREKD